MFFWAVAIATAASCTAEAEDLFGAYFKSSTPVTSNLRSLQAVPSSADGFVYANFYGAAGCAGPVIAASGRLTNQCIIAYEDHNSSVATGSYKYTCADGIAYTTQYTDTYCHNVVNTYQQTLVCKDNEEGYASAVGYCGTDPSIVPVPTVGNFTTQINYDSPTTCAATIEQFKSYLNDECISIAGTYSKYNFPTKTSYASAGCTGATTTTNLSATCEPVTTYPVGDNNHLASKWTADSVISTGLLYPAGFVYVNFYDMTNCVGSPIAATGRPTNKCIVSYDDPNSNTPTGSYMYTCNEGTAYTQQYSDTACTAKIGNGYQEVLNICQNAVGKYESAIGYCNKDPSQIPLPPGQFTTQINYGSTDSCAAPTPIDQYKAYLNDHCFNLDAGVSTKYHYPNMTSYTTNTCTGTATVTGLSEYCQAVTEYPVGNKNHLASVWTDSDDIKTGYTFDDGYLYFNFYQDDDCSNQVVAIEGQLTNKCLLLYGDDSGTPTGSHMWACDNDYGYETVYSDLNCEVLAPNTTVTEKSLACANMPGRYASVQGMCNTNPNRLPLPNDQFVSEILYNAPGVCDVPAEFNSFLNKNCIRGSTQKSYSFDYPNVIFYNDATCTTVDRTEAIPTTCVAVAQYPANNQVAAQWFYGYVPYEDSAAPTMVPTAAPTQTSYDDGFVYVNFYEDSGCTGTILAVEGRPTGVCLQAYGDPNSNTVTGSYIFTCAGDYSHTYKFTDANCKVPLASTSNQLRCSNQLGTFRSVQGMCNADPSKLPLTTSTYVTDIQWDAPTSCGDKVALFYSVLDDHCITTPGQPAYKYDFPVKHTYVGTTCTGPIATNETISTDCMPVLAYPSTVATAHQMFYGDVNFGGSSSSDELSTGAIVGIAVGGAAAVVGVAAGAYFLMGSGAAAASSSAATGAGASAVNPMASAV